MSTEGAAQGAKQDIVAVHEKLTIFTVASCKHVNTIAVPFAAVRGGVSRFWSANEKEVPLQYALCQSHALRLAVLICVRFVLVTVLRSMLADCGPGAASSFLRGCTMVLLEARSACTYLPCSLVPPATYDRHYNNSFEHLLLLIASSCFGSGSEQFLVNKQQSIHAPSSTLSLAVDIIQPLRSHCTHALSFTGTAASMRKVRSVRPYSQSAASQRLELRKRRT